MSGKIVSFGPPSSRKSWLGWAPALGLWHPRLGNTKERADATSVARGQVIGWAEEVIIPQRAEEPVPVALSSAAPDAQADHALRFHTLMLPHLDAAYNLARYLLRDVDAAEDVVQDAFLRAFRAFDHYRGGDPRAWLFTIVRNRCHSWARAAASGPVSLDETKEPDDEDPDSDRSADSLLVDPGDTPETALLRQDEIATVRELIEQLPLSFREALVLREMEEFSYQEIAEIAGVPIGTVMSRLARARQLLAAAWRRRNANHEGAAP
ncbi:sigma-70 family RNA polymerase sigma factor [Microvirga sp. 2TAF3]|uniref:sigma-70 family RNA polymerase sigma factor n=1 Tax=Microvirga sp. 2TAF3 TaxID=3233014 RepID=UPI003F9DF923